MKIQAYSLYEFCQEVQAAILAGKRFDFDTNENFPTSYGSMLHAGMKDAEDAEDEIQTISEFIPKEQTVLTEEVTQDLSLVKRTRKSKE